MWRAAAVAVATIAVESFSEAFEDDLVAADRSVVGEHAAVECWGVVQGEDSSSNALGGRFTRSIR